jgi:hypothetical protein
MAEKPGYFALCMTACAFTALIGGCQQSPGVSHRRLIEHQAMIDFSGLKSAEAIENVNVHAAIPRNWEVRKPQTSAMYTHQQWRSPSTKTGVGVAHLRLPLPITTGMLYWIAKREYSKKANDGRILSEWTDDLGRRWFEAENDKYRIRGYTIVQGLQAWVIYFGHKYKLPLDPAELSLAARAADSIVPNLDRKPTKPQAKTPAAGPLQ